MQGNGNGNDSRIIIPDKSVIGSKQVKLFKPNGETVSFSNKHAVAARALKDLNIVKKDPMGRLQVYMESLLAADPEKGAERVRMLWAKVGDLITKSFSPEVAPVQGDPSKDMINERLDKCVELVLALAGEGWVCTRIIDELPRLFNAKIREGDVQPPSRNSWGVKEECEVELDLTEEIEHG